MLVHTQIRAILVAALLCIVGAVAVCADSGTPGLQFAVQTLPTQAQLPVANINTVFQSSDGFFWYGTIGGGLCRDNGYQIHSFRPADIVGVTAANDIMCINEDASGNIWIGTSAGLYCLDRKTMCLSAVNDLRGMVFAISRDSKGSLWVGMDNRVLRYAADGGRLLDAYDDLPSWRVNNFFEDSRHDFYALLSGQLVKRDASGHFRAVQLSLDIDPIGMAEDAGGGLWIATWDKGVVHLDVATGTVTEQPVTHTTRDKARCLSLLIDRNDGLLWVTTYDNLYVYRIEGSRLVPYDAAPLLPSCNRILDILYQDRDGNIWVPGFIPNTFIVSHNKNSIRRLAINAMRDKTGYPLIPDRIVRRGSDYWIYQGRMGLMHYSGMTGQLSMAGGDKYSICIEPDRGGDGLWAAQGSNLMRLYSDVTVHEALVARLPEYITAIQDNGAGCLYIGTAQGVYEFSLAGMTYRLLCHSQGPVTDIALCAGQLYYVAQQKGLYRIFMSQVRRPPHDAATAAAAADTSACCLSSSPFLSAIAVNTDGTLWAVGRDGKVFYTRHDSLVQDRLMSGTGGEAFFDVACDVRGHVWTLSNQRACEYNPKTQAFRTIRNTDAQVDAAYFFHLEEMAGDSIGIGAAGVLCIVPSSPELDKLSQSGRRPRVTALLFGDSTRVVDGATTHFDIPGWQSTIGLQLSTLDIFGAREISFAYRIEGVNPDWIYLPQGMNTLYVSNLPKGNYRLHLRATDASGCWQEDETVILLHRLPVWWQTWWAVLLLALLAAVPLYCLWLVSVRVRKLRQIQRQRKEMALREIATPSGEELLAEREQEFLTDAKNLIEQHIADAQYNVESLASDLCMSRSNLLRRLRPLTGMSPVEFIRDIRLKYAAQLLSESPDLPMVEVARRVGFASPGYFSKCFKERFGVLPTQWNDETNAEKE